MEETNKTSQVLSRIIGESALHSSPEIQPPSNVKFRGVGEATEQLEEAINKNLMSEFDNKSKKESLIMADSVNNIKDDLGQTFSYINVMEEIVKDNILEVMQSYDMCACNRCVMDTMALTLTNLPSKYVVIDQDQHSPLLNYHMNHYRTAVITALSSSCKLIKENPRH